MPKRKRNQSSASPDPTDPNRTLARQKKLCTTRLSSAVKPLTAALRLGAGFERQKFSRRRKTAAQIKDAKALERLDKEYAVLKSLDVPSLAERHLRKTVGKVKSLAGHEALKEWLEGTTGEKGGVARAQPTDAVWLNVTARLYKVSAVREVLDAVVEDLKEVLGVGGAAPAQKRKSSRDDEKPKKKAKVQKDSEEEDSDDAGSYDEEEAFKAFDARIAAPSSGEEDSDDSLSEGHRPSSIEDSEEEWEGFSPEDPDSESDPEELDDVILTGKMEVRADDEYSGGSVSEEEEESETEGSESEAEPPPPKAKAKAKVTYETPSNSAFLPALSNIGYMAGSDSEASDLDIDVAPKKNRRGQRARQKIWEQKYGEKAKHYEKEDRNQGWDPKRGAVDDSRRGGKVGRGSRGGMRGGRGPERSGKNAMTLGPRKTEHAKKDDSGPLHPSWQAAKEAKERKMVAKPAGKKTLFD